MGNKICIKSDFSDFYDIGYVNNLDGGIIYNRFIGNSMQRGSALSYLNNIGIKTIDIRQVSHFTPIDGYLVVYTDTKAHGGNGKKIMTVEDARSQYINCPASIYIKKKDRKYYKFLQVGKKRILLTLQQQEEFDLTRGKLVDISKYPDSYNDTIKLPIYSIDYISSSDVLACDFNQVQRLTNVFIDKYMSSGEIINEIYESIIRYNKGAY